MADQRLTEPDMVDELGHGGRRLGQPADDSEPVDVRQGLVEDPELAQLLRLVDDGGDRAANPGWRGAQSSLRSDSAMQWETGRARITAMTVYIKQR